MNKPQTDITEIVEQLNTQQQPTKVSQTALEQYFRLAPTPASKGMCYQAMIMHEGFTSLYANTIGIIQQKLQHRRVKKISMHNPDYSTNTVDLGFYQRRKK